MRMQLVLGFVVLLMSAWFAPEAARAGGPDLDFELVLLGSAGSSPVSGDFVLRDEASWLEFLRAAAPQGSVIVPIDFAHEIVVATVGGPQPDTCHGVGIAAIERVRGRRAVRVLVHDGGPPVLSGCGPCLPVTTNPIHAVVVSRPLGDVEFVHEVTPFDCGCRFGIAGEVSPSCIVPQ